jgi:asparagine synthase (glutamine-hydrolysing)
MCGIAGFLLTHGEAQPEWVRAMCDTIRHRGPDDEGVHISGGCGIGMRRLSIIDLSTGHQPVPNEDKSIWVVFNGEIYNYGDLRESLMAKGHRFATHSDTETLVHLYEQEGVEGLSKLRGMFAFAIWDANKRSIFLARDRFGKKPLYYSIGPKGLFFASELKSLHAIGVPDGIDEEALKLYFQFSYIPDPASPFRNVRKLMPGTWLTFNADGQTRTGRYWQMPVPVESAAPGFTEDHACDRIRATFDDSVRIRMIADVPLGAFLSGGIDSSLVVASMALQSREPVKTFSIGFKEQKFNELLYARQVAEKYGTEHHEILVEPDSISLIRKLVDHFDEPFGDYSAIPTYIVSEFAARHVKVALSGDGGDELFGGYDSFFAIDNKRYLDGVPRPIRALAGGAAEMLPYSAYGKNFLRMWSRPNPIERYFELSYCHYFLRREMLQSDWMLPTDEAFFRRTFADALVPGDADVLTQAMYFEATAKLTGDMLVKVDRMSMAASLEVRCPLLDHELAGVAATIPHAWKMRDRKGKRILLKALGDRLPSELLTRPKQGFGIPLCDWFRGPLREFLWDHLNSPTFLQRGIVRREFVMHLLEEHDRGRRDNSYWLWWLLMLELWFRSLPHPERLPNSVITTFSPSAAVTRQV